MNEVPFLDLAAINARHLPAMREALERVSARGHWVLGPELEQFEQEFAAYCGTRHVVGVGNGLDALELTLRAWGIGTGDEVLVPSRTFVATWMAVTLTGAVPIAVTCDDHTHTMDGMAVERAITPRTRAVIPVHLYGRPADMTTIGEIARDRGLKVLEDAAQAHGARWQGRRIGALGDAAAFSFYPAKNLGALGDGGAVTTNDDALASSLRRCRNYGSSQRYLHECIGRNSRLDELQAAFLRLKLPLLDADNAQRSRIAAFYRTALADTPGLRLPMADVPGAESVWHLYVVQHPKREILIERLAAEGIQCHVHYPRHPGAQPAYGGMLGCSADDDEAARTVLSLPIGPTMSDQDAERVAQSVRRVTEELA